MRATSPMSSGLIYTLATLCRNYNRSHKPSEPMVACSIPDIEGLAADTFKDHGSTTVLSCPLPPRGYDSYRLEKALL